MKRDYSHLTKFSPKQIIVIMTLASGLNYRQTCLKANISRSCLRNWRQDPDFIKAIEIEKLYLIEQLDNELLELRLSAVQTLKKALANPDIPEGKKISICFNVICSIGLHRRLRLVENKRNNNVIPLNIRLNQIKSDTPSHVFSK